MKALLTLILILVAVVVLKSDARAPFFASDYLFLDQVAGKSLPASLSAPDAIGTYYRPVSRQGWFWLLSRMGGGEPWLFYVANLTLLLISLGLLGWLAWSLAGPVAAVIAVTLVGFHEATDVVTHWAASSQDLLAVTCSLATIALHRAGARVPAAIALFLALMSKETAIVTPLIAILVDRRSNERLSLAVRRSAPLFVSVVIAAALWLLAVTRSPSAPPETPITFGGIVAALYHLGHLAIGLEWHRGGSGPVRPSIVTLIAVPLVLALIAWMWPGRTSRRTRYGSNANAPSPGRALLTGILWAALAALPVAAAADTWSSYQYLLALCGAGMALGAMLSLAPRPAALLAVALILFTTDQVRRSGEFATVRDKWTTRSHLNRAAIVQGSATQERMIATLKRARPDLPPNSTLYFTGIPESAGFPVGDGPVLRWAYRDPTVRAYLATDFTAARAQRGPNFFFVADGSELRELRETDEVRDLALDIVFAERLDAGRDALRHLLHKNPKDDASRYWLAWVEEARGEHSATVEHLSALGARVVPTDSVFLTQAPPRDDTYSNWRDWIAWKRSPFKVYQDADKRMAEGDSTEAQAILGRAVREHPFIADMHARLADVALVNADHATAAVEAYAARVLAPEAPRAWRRWTTILLRAGRPEQALPALERYLELAGDRGRDDREAQEILEGLRNGLAMMGAGPLPSRGTPGSGL